MRLALDVALAACFVAVMATALVQEAPHEYLGLAACVLTVAHVVVNRRRVVALVRGRKTARSIATAAIDAAVLLCIVAMFGSALVLSKHAFGFLPALPGAAVARQVHMGCSYWLFALVAVHAGMHVRVWDARRAPAGKALTALLLAAVAAFGIWSLIDLGMPDYLLLRVQFAFVDADKPLALAFAQFAAAGAAIAAASSLVFNYRRNK